jgi:cysteine desulfurase
MDIYLDYNGTTPIDPQVAAAMQPYIETHFGNPSTSHAFGPPAKAGLNRARLQVASLLGALPEEIVFTSGGTEANNHALIGTVRALKDKGRHIITSAIEHPAILEVCKYLEDFEGCAVTYLPVDAAGRVDLADVEAAITDETILITIMHANNEVGTLQPVAQIAEIAHARGVRVHTDAAQSVGKVSTRVDELGVDLLSIAGHKLYAPKGVGALFIRAGTALEHLMFGAGQECGVRPGTENMIGISGLGEACALIGAKACPGSVHRDRLQAAFPEAVVNGEAAERLPNTLSLSFPGKRANEILTRLKSVCASAGAACHSDSIQISSVLQAMGVPEHIAMGTIRLSTGRFTTDGEIERAIKDLTEATTP